MIKIMGASLIGPRAMAHFIEGVRPADDVIYVREIVQEYYRCETVYGVRADIAICQMINETGWLQFDGSVPRERNNFAGLGATSGKFPEGETFLTIADGVEAHVQHLYAYASRSELPRGVDLLDMRFRYVKRGSAQYVEELSMKWAMTKDYGERLIKIYERAVKSAITRLVSEL